MDETLRDAGFAGFCLLALKEGFVLIGRLAHKKGHEEQSGFRIEVALMQLAEAVKNQTVVLQESIKTQNSLLAEMHREIVDQKAALARLEAKQEHRWRD